MRFAVAGDYLAQLSVDRNDDFDAIRDYVCSSEVRFVNLETSLFGDGDESRKGCTAPDFKDGIIERLAQLSKPYGTEIIVGDDGLGHVRLD